MTLNENAAAISFSNNYARRMADEAYSFYLTAKKFLQVWNGGGYSSIIPGDSNTLDDGSVPASQGGSYPGQPTNGDGRLPITDNQIQILVSNMTSFVNSFEASTNLILNQTIVVQVNGQARF